MRKTVPQYTIFTCDCCGREQDDKERQMSLVEAQSTEDFGNALEVFWFKWQRPYAQDNPMKMDVCKECALRIHDAIQDVIRKASAENVQEQLAIIERTHS